MGKTARGKRDKTGPYKDSLEAKKKGGKRGQCYKKKTKKKWKKQLRIY